MKKRKIIELSPPLPPKDWLSTFQLIQQMRADYKAPVDTMGCDRLAKSTNPKDQRFQKLVALMLSPQTKDTITSAAFNKLNDHFKTDGLTVKNILLEPVESIQELIKPVGFYRRKAVFLKKAASILQEEHDGDVPDSVEALTKLPGVGPKIAYLALQVAHDRVDGIGVDTHVHRICNRLEWVKSKDAEETRIALQQWLPKEFWTEINPLLVGFGQTVCLPVRPKCADCLVKCPFYYSSNKS